jgi:hypothetical protein
MGTGLAASTRRTRRARWSTSCARTAIEARDRYPVDIDDEILLAWKKRSGSRSVKAI